MEVTGHLHARLLFFRERTFVGGPQRQTGSLGEEKNLLSLWGLEPQTVQPVA